MDNVNFLLEQVREDVTHIAFLEGDDIITPDYLEKKLAIFNQFPEVKMVYNNLDFIDSHGKVFLKNYLKTAKYLLKNQTISSDEFFSSETWYGSYSSLMFEKSALLKLGIRNPTTNKLFSVSDWDLFYRTVTTLPSYGIQDSLTHYRRHNGNFSGDVTTILKDLEIQVDVYKKNNQISKKSYKKYMNLVKIMHAMALLRHQKDRKKAFQKMRESLYLKSGSYPLIQVGGWGMLFMPVAVQQFVFRRTIKSTPPTN